MNDQEINQLVEMHIMRDNVDRDYAGSMDAARLLYFEMRDRGYEQFSCTPLGKGEYKAVFFRGKLPKSKWQLAAKAATPPRATCLAALHAMKVRLPPGTLERIHI